MNDLIDQLIGLCAGREALLRLKRRQILEEFKDNLEYKDEYPSDCQPCTDNFNTIADHSNNPKQCRSLKPWKQPDHGTTFQCKPQNPIPNESVEALESCELFRTRPIPTQKRNQDAQQLQNHATPPTSSTEHATSSPSNGMFATSELLWSNFHKAGGSNQNSEKRLTRSNTKEVLNPSQRSESFSPSGAGLHHFRTPAIMRHRDTAVDPLRQPTTSVFLDKFEVDMKNLTKGLMRDQGEKREIILPGPGKRRRIRVELEATSASPEELAQARESTTFRGDPGLQRQFQFPEAGKVDVYKKTNARRFMRSEPFFGWVRR